MSIQQEHQESFYEFPYHYLVQTGRDFRIFRHYDWGLNYASAVELIIAKVKGTGYPRSIVDIGCGDGRLARELSQEFPEAEIAGIDYSQQAVGFAKLLNKDRQISFMNVDILESNLDRTFETGILMEVLEHIEPQNANRFLKAVATLLSEGGTLHVTVPHTNVPVSRHHFRHFDSSVLLEELTPFFDPIEVVPFEKRDFRRRWLLRLFSNRLFILSNRTLNNWGYSYYKKKLFAVSDERFCQRLYVRCRRR